MLEQEATGNKGIATSNKAHYYQEQIASSNKKLLETRAIMLD